MTNQITYQQGGWTIVLTPIGDRWTATVGGKDIGTTHGTKSLCKMAIGHFIRQGKAF